MFLWPRSGDSQTLEGLTQLLIPSIFTFYSLPRRAEAPIEEESNYDLPKLCPREGQE